jgi:hypothetical protein
LTSREAGRSGEPAKVSFGERVEPLVAHVNPWVGSRRHLHPRSRCPPAGIPHQTAQHSPSAIRDPRGRMATIRRCQSERPDVADLSFSVQTVKVAPI